MLRVLLLLITCCSFQAVAFGERGHQLICSMAYKLMQPATKQQVEKLIAASPYDSFDASCSWADGVRSQPELSWSSPLHYVNMERGDQTVTMEHCPEYGCILSAIDDMQQRLKKHSEDWQALLFLSHFVADLHQPLHVSFEDDLGGNRTAVYFFGLPNNLHGVWDFALLKQAGYEQDKVLAQALFAALPANQTWTETDILDWANESAAITLQIYQEYKPGMLISEPYLERYQPILEQRLQQAAVRLVYLLDLLFN